MLISPEAERNTMPEKSKAQWPTLQRIRKFSLEGFDVGDGKSLDLSLHRTRSSSLGTADSCKHTELADRENTPQNMLLKIPFSKTQSRSAPTSPVLSGWRDSSKHQRSKTAGSAEINNNLSRHIDNNNNVQTVRSEPKDQTFQKRTISLNNPEENKSAIIAHQKQKVVQTKHDLPNATIQRNSASAEAVRRSGITGNSRAATPVVRQSTKLRKYHKETTSKSSSSKVEMLQHKLLTKSQAGSGKSKAPNETPSSQKLFNKSNPREQTEGQKVNSRNSSNERLPSSPSPHQNTELSAMTLVSLPNFFPSKLPSKHLSNFDRNDSRRHTSYSSRSRSHFHLENRLTPDSDVRRSQSLSPRFSRKTKSAEALNDNVQVKQKSTAETDDDDKYLRMEPSTHHTSHRAKDTTYTVGVPEGYLGHEIQVVVPTSKHCLQIDNKPTLTSKHIKTLSKKGVERRKIQTLRSFSMDECDSRNPENELQNKLSNSAISCKSSSLESLVPKKAVESIPDCVTERRAFLEFNRIIETNKDTGLNSRNKTLRQDSSRLLSADNKPGIPKVISDPILLRKGATDVVKLTKDKADDTSLNRPDLDSHFAHPIISISSSANLENRSSTLPSDKQSTVDSNLRRESRGSGRDQNLKAEPRSGRPAVSSSNRETNSRIVHTIHTSLSDTHSHTRPAETVQLLIQPSCSSQCDISVSESQRDICLRSQQLYQPHSSLANAGLDTSSRSNECDKLQDQNSTGTCPADSHQDNGTNTTFLVNVSVESEDTETEAIADANEIDSNDPLLLTVISGNSCKDRRRVKKTKSLNDSSRRPRKYSQISTRSLPKRRLYRSKSEGNLESILEDEEEMAGQKENESNKSKIRRLVTARRRSAVVEAPVLYVGKDGVVTATRPPAEVAIETYQDNFKAMRVLASVRTPIMQRAAVKKSALAEDIVKHVESEEDKNNNDVFVTRIIDIQNSRLKRSESIESASSYASNGPVTDGNSMAALSDHGSSSDTDCSTLSRNSSITSNEFTLTSKLLDDLRNPVIRRGSAPDSYEHLKSARSMDELHKPLSRYASDFVGQKQNLRYQRNVHSRKEIDTSPRRQVLLSQESPTGLRRKEVKGVQIERIDKKLSHPLSISTNNIPCEATHTRKVSCPEFMRKPSPDGDAKTKSLSGFRKLSLQAGDKWTPKLTRKLSFQGEGFVKKSHERKVSEPIMESAMPGDKLKTRWNMLRRKLKKEKKNSVDSMDGNPSEIQHIKNASDKHHKRERKTSSPRRDSSNSDSEIRGKDIVPPSIPCSPVVMETPEEPPLAQTRVPPCPFNVWSEGQLDIDINNDTLPLLHVAAGEGNLELLKTLVKVGVDLHETDAQGWPAVHYAICSGHFDCANFLISKGANITSYTTKVTNKYCSVIRDVIRSNHASS